MAAENQTGRTLPEGTLLGNRYVVESVLGIGGFGITYKAFDTLEQKVCAIKEFSPSGLAYRSPREMQMRVYSNTAASHYQHGMMRFLEEAQMLKRLKNVPAVVQVDECFQENHTAYFAMEYLDGTNLKKVIMAAGNAISSDDIIWMIAEVGTAMGIIHRTARILHRDISPENIYLLKDGRVKLLDFGSARQQTMDERQEFSVEFKHGFAPPEQYFRTGRQGFYTDVYALASTCYYALTGTRIPDAMDRLGEKHYVPLKELRPDMDPRISDALDRALMLDYRQRTQTMEEFVEGIRSGWNWEPEEHGAAIQPESAKKGQPYLEITAGADAGVRWKLPVNTEIKIGRSPRQSNIILDGDPLVSKVHCSLVYEEETEDFLLKDLSRNGVFVDGTRLDWGKEYRYSQAVEFSLAAESCRVKVEVVYE